MNLPWQHLRRQLHWVTSMGAGMVLRNPTLLIRPFIQREALASSRLEGTHAECEALVLGEGDVNDNGR